MIKKIEKISFLYFIILITYLFISSFLYCYQMIDSTILSKYLVLFGVIGFLLYFIYKIFDKNIQTHDILIIMMAIFSFLSYYYAYNPIVAFIGFKSGREGLLVILTYYIVYLVATIIHNDKYKKYLFAILTVYGIFQFLYALLQAYSISQLFGISIVGEYGYPSALFSNSNFYGSFSVLLAGLWITKYVFDDTDRINFIHLLITELFLSSIYLSGAMSSFVGLCSMLIVILFLLYIQRKNNLNIKKAVFKIFILLLTFSFLYFLYSCTSKVSVSQDIAEVASQAVTAVESGVEDSFGSGRIHIWKEGFYYFKKYRYYFTGIGIDNFFYLGHGKMIRDYNTGYFIYKAHNEYLQILFCEGIFKFITYLSFLIYLFLKAFTRILKDRKKNYLFFSIFVAFIGYSVQAFFNISITRVAPIYFLICGLLFTSSGDGYTKNE